MLEQILAHKRREVAEAMARQPMEELVAVCRGMAATRDFAGSLVRSRGQVKIIAEIKCSSPSKGVFREHFDPLELAQAYRKGGAAAISVITDTRFFRGHLSYLPLVRNHTSLPLLRKDFILHPYQLYETRSSGADAVLLIVAALKSQLKEYCDLATTLGLSCLVEVHSEPELETALAAGAKIIGINNRDLITFRTDLAVTARLLPLIPPGRLVISESGVGRREDIINLEQMGVDGVLVGEALVASSDPAVKLRELLGTLSDR